MRLILQSFTRLASAASVLAMLAVCQPSWADRLTNETDLGAGRFVWQSSVAPPGPITVIAALNERVVHVYRSGELIGVATIEAAPSATRGVYRIVPELGRPQGEIRATAILADGATSASLRLPSEFLKLVEQAAIVGSTLIVAAERTRAYAIADGGPFLTALEDERQRVPSVAGWTGTSELEAQLPAPAAIVVAVAANKAIRIDGDKADLIADLVPDATATGTHVYIRTAIAGVDGLRWLGVGIGRNASDRHIATWQGESALDQVGLADWKSAAGLGHNLGPGAVVVITDAALKPPSTTSTRPVTLLTSSQTRAPAAVVMPTQPNRSGGKPRAAPTGRPAKDEPSELSPSRFFDPVGMAGG